MYGTLALESEPLPNTTRKAWVGSPQNGVAPVRWPAVGDEPIPYCPADTLMVYHDSGELVVYVALIGGQQSLMPHDEIWFDILAGAEWERSRYEGLERALRQIVTDAELCYGEGERAYQYALLGRAALADTREEPK